MFVSEGLRMGNPEWQRFIYSRTLVVANLAHLVQGMRTNRSRDIELARYVMLKFSHGIGLNAKVHLVASP